MIGRGHELAVIDRWLEEEAPLGGVLVVEGEAGIGKTTLWNAGVELGTHEGFRVLVTRPVEAEAEAGSSFSGLLDLMDEVVEEAGPGLPPPQRHALEVALLRENSVGTPPDASAVGVATLRALRAVALRTPIVIAVDDLQWLEPATARVLGFVVRRAAGEPIAMLASVRGARDGDLPLALDRAVDAARLRRIHLGPFSPAAVHHLLKDRLAFEPPRPLLMRLHEASRGNPFLALELGAALERAGRVPAAGEPLPVSDDLRELLRQRFAGLSPAAYELLLLVAAMPARSTQVLEAALAGEELAGAPLDEALQAGILVVDGERIRFAHPLLASTRYADATPGERRRVRGRLAAVADDPEERARHLALAAEGPDAGVAAALDETADRAASRGAPEAAAELLELALRLTPPDETEDAVRRTLLAGVHHAEAGNAVAAANLLERAAHAPTGPVRAEALLRLGWVRFRDAGPIVARPIFEEALTEAEDGPPPLLAAVHSALAWMELVEGGPSGTALRHADAELAAAEVAGDTWLVSAALADVGMIRFVRGEDAEMAALERAEALQAHLDVPNAVPAVAMALMWAGRVDEARPRFESDLALAHEAGDEGGTAPLLYWLAELEWRAGDWAASFTYATECADLAEQTGQRLFRSLALALISFVEGGRGRVLRARAAGEEGLRLAEESGHFSPVMLNRHALGLLALSLGDAADADRLMGPLVKRLRAAEIFEPLIYPFPPDQTEALVALGELERAAELLQDFEEQARASDRAPGILAAVRCRALLAAARGDLDEALAQADEAVELVGPAANPLEAARALLVLGMIRRRARRRRDAADALDRATSAFEALGATVWAERTREERSRVGLRRARGMELTDTERSVAELVARGHTSREVAGMLFMSVRTVDAHLSHIYGKLGVRSRTELARRLPGGAGAGEKQI